MTIVLQESLHGLFYAPYYAAFALGAYEREAQPAEVLAETVQSYFPAAPQARLRAALARYKALGIWGRTPILPRDGYERLKAGLISGGFVKGMAYEIAVDNSLADAVVSEDPPST